MKKICSLIIAIILVVSLVGCGKDNERLSGSYIEHGDDSNRYEFVIKDTGRGDYGGDMNIFEDGEPLGTRSWYIENNLVYIDGTLCYIYRDGYLYSNDPIDGIVVSEDGTLSGYNKKFDEGETGALFFTDNFDIIQLMYWDAEANSDNRYYLAIPSYMEPEWGMYVVENDVVILYDEGETDDWKPYYYYVLDNTLRHTRLDPI